MLVCGPHFFYRNKSIGLKTHWYCRRKRTGCKAKAQTLDDNIVTFVDEHNHEY